MSFIFIRQRMKSFFQKYKSEVIPQGKTKSALQKLAFW